MMTLNHHQWNASFHIFEELS